MHHDQGCITRQEVGFFLGHLQRQWKLSGSPGSTRNNTFPGWRRLVFWLLPDSGLVSFARWCWAHLHIRGIVCAWLLRMLCSRRILSVSPSICVASSFVFSSSFLPSRRRADGIFARAVFDPHKTWAWRWMRVRQSSDWDRLRATRFGSGMRRTST